MSWTSITLGGIVALAIAYIVIVSLKQKPEYEGKQAMYDLGTPGQVVLPNASCSWAGQPCSIRFALFVEAAPRTIAKVECISGPSATTQFAPNCEDYSFKPCQCGSAAQVSVDCTNCALKDTGYLSKLLALGDFVELWASGYTTQNDKPYVPTVLKVKTGSSATSYSMEGMSLPAVPLQRWTLITIVREGKRVDVYYGAKQVASKLFEKMPVPADPAKDWSAGAAAWKGKIGLFAGVPFAAQSSADVEADVERIVNTRGVPFYMDRVSFDWSLSTPECILGDCNRLPTVKPLNPFAVYATSVA